MAPPAALELGPIQGEALGAWDWMKENKPGVVLNAILPSCNIGRVLSPQHQGAPSTVGWVQALWNGFKGQEQLKFNPPQYYVNGQDNARIHNDILAVFRELYPSHHFMDDIPALGKDLSKVGNERAEEILKRFGRP
ncbi:hypothetical protein A1O1_05574 [Capronia coronata CBS 617.96]|uniref:Uncharacterized protein n=1 Tax=Capronia coronata CBS 617.96 TaxID=1182541 RepID=W9Y7X9_9EURO|nr:uncharacterized protein A1O1_05574 [Capronia coronata CBS 617.96]EXJ88643.1 hypothetical protein A1O1_05574 [Capronia coronata CBS 617.96]